MEHIVQLVLADQQPDLVDEDDCNEPVPGSRLSLAECARMLLAVEETLSTSVHFSLEDADADNALAQRMAEASIQPSKQMTLS